MNLDKQIIEAARIEGYLTAPSNPKYPDIVVWLNPDGTRLGVGEDKLPDYLNDHNAIQRLVDKLDHYEMIAYKHQLSWICKFEVVPPIWTENATCEQKLEAILKAYKVWKED